VASGVTDKRVLPRTSIANNFDSLFFSHLLTLALLFFLWSLVRFQQLVSFLAPLALCLNNLKGITASNIILTFRFYLVGITSNNKNKFDPFGNQIYILIPPG
jgi:hypothetical protein